MPVHQCTSRDLEDVVDALEKANERICSTSYAGDDCFVIFTYVAPRVGRPAKGTETR